MSGGVRRLSIQPTPEGDPACHGNRAKPPRIGHPAGRWCAARARLTDGPTSERLGIIMETQVEARQHDPDRSGNGAGRLPGPRRFMHSCGGKRPGNADGVWRAGNQSAAIGHIDFDPIPCQRAGGYWPEQLAVRRRRRRRGGTRHGRLWSRISRGCGGAK